jgi:hypothetical protein
MARHMLMYHVGIPVAVFVVLLVVGMPLVTAFGIGMMAGCASMVLMMATGGGHRGQQPPVDHTTDQDTQPPAAHR